MEDCLLSIQPGISAMADYALLFCIFAAQCCCPNMPLKTIPHWGLLHRLQAELYSHDEKLSLKCFIQLSIHVSFGHEPLPFAHIVGHCVWDCNYCGNAGHFMPSCLINFLINVLLFL